MKYAFGLFILSTITLSTTASTKPGCPPIDPRIRCIHFHEQCKSDSECKPGQLCCGHTCGTNCMEPFPLPPSQPNTCWLPKDKGPCKALIPRFYYDSNTYKCRKFIYGGCKGNANNFKTKKECNQECKKSVCTLPMDPGPCKGSFKKWYYNVATGKCEKFIYGGCKGNGNRFNRKRGCMKNCKGVKPTPPPSPSPPPPPPTDPVKSKPGLCPKPSGRPGICVEGCGGDFNCPGYQKCCSNGCGHVCTNPAGPSPSPPPPPPFPPHSICEKGTPFPNINCGFGSGRNPCPRGYYCKTEATDHYAVCCQNPCSYGRPHSTLSCGMVIGSNKCPNGYSCVAGAADEFFACCPTRPSPSPPPPPPPPPPFPPQSICEKGTPFPNINCGLGPASKTCPRSYYCKTHPTDHYAVCCQNPCSYGVPHPTLSCGMVIGSNRCPTGYSCVAGAADDFFACCPTKPSPSPPPPPTPPGKSKPGSCPKPKSGTAGICLQRCNGDFDCRGNEKCCSNGCGNECLDPEVPPSSTQLPPFPSSVCERGTQLPNLNCGLRPCPRGYYCKFDPTKSLRVCCRNPCSIGIPNTKLKCGLVVGSNKCTNGYSCVPGPADEPPVCCQTRKTKPGSCPIPKSEMAGICLQRCNGDFDCRGNAKCCSNGCGNECSNPEDNVPKCRIGQPLSNIFCGRGRNRQDCPKGYSCNIHPTDKYAVCCRNDNVPICRLGQPLSNINCGRGPNRQNCPKGYYCNIHPTDKYAVCCRNGNIYVEYVDSPTIRFE